MGGKPAVYQRMLARFVKELADLPSVLQSGLARGDGASAERELHTLKGVTATLGINALAAEAGQAEKALASTSPPSSDG